MNIHFRVMPKGYGKASEDVRQYIYYLIEDIERLENIINKAIEYINEFEYYIPEDNKEEIIQILRGD